MLTKKVPRRPSRKEFVHNFFVDLGTVYFDKNEKGKVTTFPLINRHKIHPALSTWLSKEGIKTIDADSIGTLSDIVVFLYDYGLRFLIKEPLIKPSDPRYPPPLQLSTEWETIHPLLHPKHISDAERKIEPKIFLCTFQAMCNLLDNVKERLHNNSTITNSEFYDSLGNCNIDDPGLFQFLFLICNDKFASFLRYYGREQKKEKKKNKNPTLWKFW